MTFLVLAVALAAAPIGDAQRLVAAVRSGAREEIARVARRLGPARVGALLEKGDAAVQQAALEAAPALDEAWTLLPIIAARLEQRPAARAAARIAHALAADRLAAEREEIDDDVRREAASACASAATNAALPAALRGDALLCANDLGDRELALSLASDGDDELRGDVMTVLGASAGGERERAALQAAGADASPHVAARALAALCAHDARGTMVQLEPDARVRLRELAGDATLDRGLRLRLASCLRSSADAADRAAARKLRP